MNIFSKTILGAFFCLLISTCFGLTPSFQSVQQIGGASDNSIQQMAVDADGNRFLVGWFEGRLTMGSAVLVSEGSQNMFIAKLDPKGQVLWLRQASSSSMGLFVWPMRPAAAAVDSSGNLLVLGIFNAQARFGQTVLNARGVNDIFLIKYDSAGNLVWVRQAGGGADFGTFPSFLFIDENNNYYITGSLCKGKTLFGGGTGGGPQKQVTVTAGYDMFAAKYDYSGALVWAWSGLSTKGVGQGGQIFGSSSGVGVMGSIDDKPHVVWCDGAGNPWLPVPYFDLNAGASAFFFSRVSDSPGLTFSFYFTGGNVTVGTNVLSQANGNYGIAHYDNQSHVTWVRQFSSAMKVVAGPHGALYSFGPDWGDILRLDPQSGNTLWNMTCRAAIASLLPNDDGSLLLAGSFPDPSVTLGTFTLSTTADTGSFIARLSDVPQFDWVQRAAGAEVDAGAKSVAIDPAGNRYVAGWFNGPASFSGNQPQSVDDSQDIFLAKYDKKGTLLWVRPAGGSGWDEGMSVAVDRAGNCYLTGYFEQTASFGQSNLVSRGEGDIFLAKYNSEGTLQWLRQGGGTGDDYGTSVAVDGGGNCYLTGAFEETAQFGTNQLTSHGDYDLFLAKFSPTGTQLWIRQVGDSGDDRAFGVAADATGNCYLTGYFSDYATFGSIDVNGFGGHDVFLAKYNGAGVPQWVSRAGGESRDNGYGIALDPAGNIYITGLFQDTADFGGILLTSAGDNDAFAAKYSPAGKCLWAKGFGGTADDQAEGIAVDRLGNVYLTGEFMVGATFGDYQLTSQGFEDAFLLKLDGNNGDVLWTKQAGGSGSDYGYSIAIDGEQNWTWAGYFEDTVQFDGQPFTAKYGDMFLATAAPFVNSRVLSAADSEGVLGQTVSIPLNLTAQGNENAFSFTLTFDPTVLTNPVVVPGNGTNNAGVTQFIVNTQRAAQGLLGFVAALDANQVMSPGSTQLFLVTFTVISNTPAASTTIDFSDQIVVREIDTAQGEYVSVDYALGTLSVIRGYEGDVAPRPGGDTKVTLIDWVQEKRFVAGLDTPDAGDEFIRADCSPYIVNDVPVRGDGAITLGDWVQVGRLAAKLDPLKPQAGPDKVHSQIVLRTPTRPPVGGPRPLITGRQLRVTDVNLAPGQAGDLLVQIDAQGGEDAVGFSLTLDPGLLEFTGAQLGSDANNASLVLNTNTLANGQLGVLLSLPSITGLDAGTRTLLKIGVKASAAEGNWNSRVDFVGYPVDLEVVDGNAQSLAADYLGAAITIGTTKPTMANPRIVAGAFQFSAEGFPAGSLVIEASTNLRDWLPIYTNSSASSTITVPGAVTDPQRYFRAVAR